MKLNRIILIGVISALALLALASWYYIERSVDPIANELAIVAPKVMGYNNDDPRDLLIRIMESDINSSNIADTTFLVARLLTTERPPGPKSVRTFTPGPAWTATKEQASPLMRFRMTQFERTASWSGMSRYLMDLYEKNFGTARESAHYLLNYKNYLPIPGMVLAQALYEKLGLEASFQVDQEVSEKSKKAIRQLLADNSFIDWAKSKTRSLRQYAGNANPTLGLYDWITYPQYAEKVGLNRFRQDADVYYDLGGGFETPEVKRLLGHDFVSFDVLSPKMARKFNLLAFQLDSWRKPSLDQERVHTLKALDHEAYLAKLDQIPFRHFNIFEDSFLPKHKSYFITSFDFLGSAVGTHAENAFYMQNNTIPKIFATTYVGVRRIIELVALGKDVDLFAVLGSPYRLYRFQTVYLSFRNHRLVSEKLLPRDLEGPASSLKRIANKVH
jgi:hypothetical protein